ncbi:hypothetical protein [Nonomuraea gerenzanensis]|uniref:hypothetical protein n=1 Tax=Nonomuraea gerenzanensis TaxID=93944 RepID=UPI001CDA5116|nr:hypothetical protein [Nonomuraea gerenzanensis]UBU18253.1 hypothetical protein LCN96_25470 [Nonomuraea gerenzanensis]
MPPLVGPRPAGGLGASDAHALDASDASDTGEAPPRAAAVAMAMSRLRAAAGYRRHF